MTSAPVRRHILTKTVLTAAVAWPLLSTAAAWRFVRILKIHDDIPPSSLSFSRAPSTAF